MKKIVITYGLISAGISAIMWTIIMSFMKQNQDFGFESSMIVGYSAMVISFLMIYFGMAAYRDNKGGGHITYGKAVQVGLWISLIACVCYVISWAVIYNTLVPDYMDKYITGQIDAMKASGASAEKIEKASAEMNTMKENYKKPLYFFLYTFLEPTPVAILVTLISAFVVRMKSKRKTNPQVI